MPEFIPKLNQTTNFFELYQYACGDSEVPPIYHFWASLAILASAVENRIWYEKFKDERLYPNLYVFLLGPGGLGKGTAISQVMRLAKAALRTRIYRGALTKAHLVDVLGKPVLRPDGSKVVQDPKLWIVFDELKNDVGSNPQLTEALIAALTEIYTATNYTLEDGTRGSGQTSIQNPLVNWMVGTTEAWLKQVLTKDLVDSGFTARTCFVFGEHNFDKRRPEIIYPPDYAEVMEHLVLRLQMLQMTEGEISMTQAAKAEEKYWYMTRPNPEEEVMYSIWRRHHDMLLKFAMLLALADGKEAVIQSIHIKRAISMVKVLEKFTERLLEVAHETVDTKPSNEIAEYIKKKKEIGHSQLLRYFRTKRGMSAEKLKKAVWALQNEGSIQATRTNTGAGVYHWVG